MIIKLFLLGRPGSGKSSCYQFIVQYMKKKLPSWSVIPFDDYEILWKKFLEDTRGEVFFATMPGGFGIYYPPIVLSDVLIELEEISQKFILDTNRDLLVTIEFARADYYQSLKLFSDDFRKGAYYLFIETDIETCKNRIHKRYFSGLQSRKHFVADEIMENYYGVDSQQYMLTDFKKDFGVDDGRIRIIDNYSTWDKFTEQVNLFIASLIEQENL